MSHGATSAGLFKQPRAVWAVAFACVVSFMGIGLVDPILPSLASKLHATPAQVSLLFTSYLVVTAAAMLVTNWVSSRIGAKRTLIAGLILIVIFAGLAGTANSISGIVGFRAGWGLGNALFIATSLAVIVASASGGFGGAIILYETALGCGIAVGPLLGGALGGISWRGPFFGVCVLMAIALLATAVLVPPTGKPAHHTSLAAPIKALKHRGLLVMSLTALCYNWGFFTLLGYAPYYMGTSKALSPIELGLVFCGWGIFVALLSIWGAPRLHRRFGTAPTLYGNLAGLAIVLALIGLAVPSVLPTWVGGTGAGSGWPVVVIVATVVSGIFIGVNNTLTTQAVMLVSPVERPVASASYGFVRFIGGGIAPYVAGKIAEASNSHVPFLIGAGAMLVGIAVLSTGHGLLRDAEAAMRAGVEEAVPADGALPAKPLGALVPVGEPVDVAGTRPIVLAVDDGPAAAMATARAAALAAERGATVEVLHVHETDVIGDEAVDRESLAAAQALVATRVEALRAAGVRAAGYVLRSIGDHARIGDVIGSHAAHVDAQAIVIGEPSGGAFARLVDADGTRELLADAPGEILIVSPDTARSR